MSSGSIDEIIGQSSFDQTKRLKDDMAKLLEQFNKTANAAKLLNAAIGNANSMNIANAKMNEQSALLKELQSLKNQLLTAQAKLNNAYSDEAKALAAANLARQKANADVKASVTLETSRIGSLDAMKAALAKLTAQYSAMSRAERESATGKGVITNLQATYVEVVKLEKAMGNYSRNVGNYQHQLFGFSQVLRELPAFAYGASVGVGALSNNLPILMDNFRQVSKAINETTGKANGSLGALGIFGKSIFSLTNIFTIAVAVFTIFSKEIFAFINKLRSVDNSFKEGGKNLKEFNEAIKAGTKDAGKEVRTLQDLYKATQNINTSKAEHLKAAQELQKSYPQTFANFTQEEILAGKAEQAYLKLRTAIIETSRSKALQSKMDDFASEMLENEMRVEKAKANLYNAIEFTKNTIAKNESKLGKSTRDFDPALSENKRAQDAEVKAQKEFNDAVAETNRLKEKYKYYLDQSAISAKKAAYYEENQKAAAEKAEREKEAARKKAERAAKKASDKNARDLEAEAKEAERIRQADLDAELQALAAKIKARQEALALIINDESASRDSRLIALSEYQKLEGELLDAQGEREKQKTDVTENQKLAITKEYRYKKEQAVQDSMNKIDAIERQAQAKEIEDTILAYEQQAQADKEAASKAIEDVKQRYLAGKLTKEQYEKDIQRITLESNIVQLQIAIKYAELQSKIGGLPEDKKQKLLDDMAQLKAALLDAQVALKSNTPDYWEEQAKKIEDVIAIANKYKEAVTAIAQSIYENDVANIENRKKADQEKYDAERDAIERSGMMQAEKAKRLAVLDKEKKDRDKAYERERVTAERRRAIFQKAIDVSEIIAQTAIAVLKAPGGPISPLGIATALSGAAAAAAVIARPIPQYAEGRKGGKAEYAIVGDKYGAEMIEYADGSRYITPNKPTLTYLPKGATVYTNRELMAMYSNGVMQNYAANGAINVDTNYKEFVKQAAKQNEKMDTLIDAVKQTKIKQSFTFNSDYYTLIKQTIR